MSKGARDLTRRDLLRKGALGGLGLASLGPLAGMMDMSRASASEPRAMTTSGITPELIAAAKKEGHLNVITLPPDWANYGEIISTFSKRYGIMINSENPNGSSADEIQAVKSLKGQSREPDVVDVSFVFAQKGVEQGLWQPYKVAEWESIPSAIKNASGYWWADYWGVQAFLSVDSIVKVAPKSWADLLKPMYKGMVSIDGDPRSAGNAFAAVFAAALANGGSLDNIQPGVDFFAKLNKMGNFNPTDNLPANIAKGATPIAIKWDYLLLGYRDELKGNPAVTVNIPSDGVYGGPYAQAISKFAPNPNAAKLWEEFLYSDEGQLLWLKGYTHPARFNDLAKRKAIPAALLAKLPPAAAYKNVKFASLAQIAKASAVLQKQWGPKVVGS